MRHIKLTPVLLLAVGGFVGTATATPFWYWYNANDNVYPEEEGWTRYIRAGGAQRNTSPVCSVFWDF